MPIPNFEAAGNLKDWPPNVSGKATQAAVFGVYHLERGRVCDILWTGQFPDLEPAMYWAAKKEVQAVRKDKWIMASRVLWQHELTPEQAVGICYATMKPQMDSAIDGVERDGSVDNIEIGEGPMKQVQVGQASGLYVEIPDPEDAEAEPLASFFAPPDIFEPLDEDEDDPPFIGGSPPNNN